MPLTLLEAAAFFRASAARAETELAGLVTQVVARGAANARALVGNRQDGWPELSSATVNGFRHPRAGWIPGRIELGYGGAEAPLLRDGTMKESVSFVSAGLAGEVGSDLQIARFQELGVANSEYSIPPRPFISRGLEMAVAESLPELAEAVMINLLVPKL